ncbi:MAG: nickel-responsive transcriptional regulator NikR [Holophagales bacterium]|jgi:CopG family nickel-responsive transcriptional regulator|nr:nickel-responsive transcriptional regulator NikR [Holophagales bacterium]MBK9964954.1 nickel-responsive transcriptional regulator NikR [Holophagales bacterium]
MELERISLAIDPDLLAKFDRILAESGVANRSEAVRDLIRKRLVEEEEDPRAEAAASLTLVYDHDTRELSDRLVEIGHEHHAQILSTLHVHLDHDLCLEVMALRGKRRDLRRLASRVLGLKGVLHGGLVVSSLDVLAEVKR